MIGGKWTTFRAFAEQATDEVLSELGRTRQVGTLSRPIGGGKDFPDAAVILERDLISKHGIGPARAAHLVATYGTTATELLAFCQNRPDDEALSPETEFTAAEIAFLASRESVSVTPGQAAEMAPVAPLLDLSIDFMLFLMKSSSSWYLRNSVRLS